MKTRLAKKIVGRIFCFKNFDSNYLPYSKPQQTKAVRIAYRQILTDANRPLLVDAIPIHKIPLKWRKVKGFLPGEFDNSKAE